MDGIKRWKYNDKESNKVKEEINILEAIEETKSELEVARNLFDSVEDFKLIEIAIFAEEKAKRRYSYLIMLAKQKGIKVSNEYILEHCVKFAE